MFLKIVFFFNAVAVLRLMLLEGLIVEMKVHLVACLSFLSLSSLIIHTKSIYHVSCLRFIMYARIRETGSIVRQRTMDTGSEENRND